MVIPPCAAPQHHFPQGCCKPYAQLRSNPATVPYAGPSNSNRRNSPQTTVQDGRLVRKKGHFGESLRQAALLAQNPRSITFRDVMILAYVALCLYYAYFVASNLGQLFFAAPGGNSAMERGNICRGLGSIACLNRYNWIVVREIWRWLERCVVWVPAVAVGIFFGEELIGWARRK
jgi:hypothetical protein